MDLQFSQSSESTDDSLDVRTVPIGGRGGMEPSGSGGSRKRRNNRVELNDDEYKKRRERNNEAVRKCRIKSREKSKEMAEKVNFLREENAVLSQKVQILSKELTLLKELFLTHAKGPVTGSNGKTVSITDVIQKQSAQEVPTQAGDHQYYRPSSSANKAVIKLETVESGSEDEEGESIVDLSVRRPGMVLDKYVSENSS